MKVNKVGLLQFEPLKQNDLFSIIIMILIIIIVIIILILILILMIIIIMIMMIIWIIIIIWIKIMINCFRRYSHNFCSYLKSLSKHVDDIVSDDRITNCKIIETMRFFKITYNSNENKFLSFAYGCTNDVAVLDKFDANGVSIFSFKRHAFPDRVANLVLVYRRQSLGILEFVKLNAKLTSSKFHMYYSFIYIIVRDFNIDILKVSKNELLDRLTDHAQILNKQAHVFGSLKGYVYIKKTLMEKMSITIIAENIYFSNHDVVRTIIEKKCCWFFY